MRILFVHWHEAEAAELARPLIDAGWDVDVEYRASALSGIARYRESPPNALVVSLRRLPSHGREVADAFRSTKWAAAVRIVFVDGEASKVAAIKRQFTDAVFVKHEAMISALRAPA